MGVFRFVGGPLNGQSIAVPDSQNTYMMESRDSTRYDRTIRGPRVEYQKKFYNSPSGELAQFELCRFEPTRR